MEKLHNRIFLKFLVGLIVIITFSQFFKFYSFFEEYSSWQYSDWLINYQGGLVRRGLIGEIFYKIHHYTGIDLDLIVLASVYILFVINAHILIKSANLIKDSYTDILIFLSPGFFLYPLMNSEVIGRKDLLFVTLFGFLIFYFEKITKNFRLIILISILYLVCLSHSGLFFYSQYLIFFYIIHKLSLKKKIPFIEIVFLLFNLFIIFILIIFFPGNENKVFLICESIKEYVSQPCATYGDRIWWLGKSASFHAGDNLRNGSNMFIRSSFIYLSSLILVFFFICKKFHGAKFMTKNQNFNNLSPIFIIVVLFSLSIPVFVLAIDWGRYISISYSSTFFIYIYLIKKKLIKFEKKINFIEFQNIKTFVVFIMIYSFSWTFPFYQAKNIKLTFKKPLYSLYYKLSNQK